MRSYTPSKDRKTALEDTEYSILKRQEMAASESGVPITPNSNPYGAQGYVPEILNHEGHHGDSGSDSDVINGYATIGRLSDEISKIRFTSRLNFTYDYAESYLPNKTVKYYVSGFADMENATRKIFDLAGDLLGFKAQETNVEDHATIRVNRTITNQSYATFPGKERLLEENFDFATDTEIGISYLAQGFSAGQKGWDNILHEVAHSLGLFHVLSYFDDDFNELEYKNNSEQLTVMSYNASPFIPGSSVDLKPATFMVADLYAFDLAYAKQGLGTKKAFTGNTVWGFNTTISQNENAIWHEWAEGSNAANGLYALADGGGIDTLDVSGWNNNTRIDLRPSEAGATTPSYSNLNGKVANLHIAVGTIIENAKGGAGNEVIFGNDADNKIWGGGGNDIIRTGKGHDRVYGEGGNDTLFSWYGKNYLHGGAGDDELVVKKSYRSVLVGGEDDDIFRFTQSAKRKVYIKDFTQGEDKIHLGAYVDRFSELKISSVGASGQSSRIDLEDRTTIFVQNMRADDFTAEDFIL